jgi:hypothetical protein
MLNTSTNPAPQVGYPKDITKTFTFSVADQEDEDYISKTQIEGGDFKTYATEFFSNELGLNLVDIK